MSEATTRLHREPVLVLAVVQTFVALVVSFGLELSSEQVGAITAAFAAVLGLIARTQVTPITPSHQE
jgi:FtsH-binding integral membrane protein